MIKKFPIKKRCCCCIFFRPNFLLAEKPLKEKIFDENLWQVLQLRLRVDSRRLLRWPFLTTLAFVCPHRCYNHNENNDSPPEILG